MAVMRTVCTPNCLNTCGLLAHVEGGRIVKVEPAPFPDQSYTRICLKGLASVERQYHPQRLRHPLTRIGDRGSGRWEQISWDEALDQIAARLSDIAGRHGSRSAAFVSMTGSYSLLATNSSARFASAFGGSVPTRDTIMGDAAGHTAMDLTLGHSTTHEQKDWPNSRLLILWGRNVAESLMNNFRFVLEAKENGARVVAIDPRFTPTAAQCDEWIPIRPGTDAALALGMIHLIIKEGLYDRRFMAQHTVGPFLVRADDGRFLRGEDGQPRAWDQSVGKDVPVSETGGPALTGSYVVEGLACAPAFQKLADLAAGYPPDKVSAITGVPEERVARLALQYATTKPAAMLLGGGTQRYYQGHQFFRAAATLAALAGNLGVPGGGANHISRWPMQAVFNTSAFNFPGGKRHASLPGMMFYDAVEEGRPWPVRSAWFAGCNFVNQAGDPNRIIGRLFPKLELIVVSEQFMTVTAEHADYVLPVTTFFEAEDITRPMDNLFVQLQHKVVEPEGECKPDIEIFTQLARKMGLGEYFDKTPEAFMEELLSSGSPMMTGITLGRLRSEGAVRINLPDPHVPFADRQFATPSGRVEFYVERLAEIEQELPAHLERLEGPGSALAEKYPLTFLTTHSRFSANSQHFFLPHVAAVCPEPVLEMSPEDARARGITDGDAVVAFNDRGKCQVKARVTGGILPGVVNVYEGWWPRDFIDGSQQALTQSVVNPDQMFIKDANWSIFDTAVEVRRAKV